MNEDKKNSTPKRLKQVLATYGSRPDKWPAHERASLKKLLDLARTEKSQKADDRDSDGLWRDYQEAQSLDQLLDHAGAGDVTDVNVTELSASIMARISENTENTEKKVHELNFGKEDPRKYNNSDKPIAHPAAIPAPGTKYSGYFVSSRKWQTAALLTATFVFGIYIGATLVADPAAETVAAITGEANFGTAELTLFETGPVELFEGDL